MKVRDLMALLKGNEDREVFVPAKSFGALQNLTEEMVFVGTDDNNEEVVEICIW